MFLGTGKKVKGLVPLRAGEKALFTMQWSTGSLKLPRLYKAACSKASFALTSQAHKHFNELFLHGSLGSYQATIIQITTRPHPARSGWLRFFSLPNANWISQLWSLIKYLTIGACELLLLESAVFWHRLFKSLTLREIWLSRFRIPDDIPHNAQRPLTKQALHGYLLVLK